MYYRALGLTALLCYCPNLTPSAATASQQRKRPEAQRTAHSHQRKQVQVLLGGGSLIAGVILLYWHMAPATTKQQQQSFPVTPPQHLQLAPQPPANLPQEDLLVSVLKERLGQSLDGLTGEPAAYLLHLLAQEASAKQALEEHIARLSASQEGSDGASLLSWLEGQLTPAHPQQEEATYKAAAGAIVDWVEAALGDGIGSSNPEPAIATLIAHLEQVGQELTEELEIDSIDDDKKDANAIEAFAEYKEGSEEEGIMVR